MTRFVERQGAFEIRQQEILNQIKEKLAAAGTDTKKVTVSIQDLLEGKLEFQMNNTSAKDTFLQSLTDADKKQIKRLFGDGEVTADKIDDLLKSSAERLKKIESAQKTLTESPSVIQKGKEKLKELAARVKQETGGQVKNGKLVGADPAKVKLPKPPIEAKLNLPNGLDSAKTTVEYVAGKKVKTTQVAKELSEEGKKALCEFIEKNGKKEDAAKNILDNVKDELKALTEGKVNNKKLIAGAAITAAVVAGIALMFRPKAKEQQTA